MRVLIRIVACAVALAVATAVVPGIELGTGSLTSKALTLLAVALIFGLVNAVIKPVVKAVGCMFYLLTLGLIALVVNGLLLWLTSVVAGKLSLPFHITGFWPAFFGAIIVSVVTWLLSILVRDKKRRNADVRL
jgi:putative membrane protein